MIGGATASAARGDTGNAQARADAGANMRAERGARGWAVRAERGEEDWASAG